MQSHKNYAINTLKSNYFILLLMKKVFLLLILALFTVNTFATNVVSSEEAQRVAKNFMSEKFGAERFNSSDLILQHTEVDENGEAVLYRFQIGEKGFIIISATNLTTPVLAYSLESNYVGNETTQYLYEKYTNSIKFVKANPHAALANTQTEWKRYSSADFKPAAKKSGDSKSLKFLEPLVTSTWNQSKYYNQYSPYDFNAKEFNDYRTPNGCVALSMSNILNYYRYPNAGTGGIGNHTVSGHPEYGKLSANFAEGTYNYDAMTNSIVNGYQGTFAEMVYHCGLAVKMQYGPDGSGAQSSEVPTVMAKHFKYTIGQFKTLAGNYGGDYNKWESEVLIPELDKYRPLYYSGYSDSYGSGHAWIIDGYMQTDSATYFHVNWGWGGADNGFFRIDNLLTTSFSSFSKNEGTIINLVPSGTVTNKPATSATRNTAIEGSISDGAGDKKYVKNSNRTWMIAAPNAKSYTFTFSKIKTEKDHDFITIYNGPTVESGIKAQYSGNYLMKAANDYWSKSFAMDFEGDTLPEPITVIADSVLVVFTSDDNDTVDYGFVINYSSELNVGPTCAAMSYPNSGWTLIASNPDDAQYRAQSTCQWRVSGGKFIDRYAFNFYTFDLKNGDFIDVFNNKNPIRPVLAYRFDAKNPPKIGEIFTVEANDVLFSFASDNWIEGNGFGIECAAQSVGEHIGIEDFSIFPNPATERINVKLSTESAESINIKLMDMAGKVLHIEEFTHSGGEFQYNTPVDHLSKGMYLLRIQTEKGQITKKIIVQ